MYIFVRKGPEMSYVFDDIGEINEASGESDNSC